MQVWSESERQALADSVNNNTLNGRVNWVPVANSLPGRTIDSCKSEYRKVLKL